MVEAVPRRVHLRRCFAGAEVIELEAFLGVLGVAALFFIIDRMAPMLTHKVPKSRAYCCHHVAEVEDGSPYRDTTVRAQTCGYKVKYTVEAGHMFPRCPIHHCEMMELDK